MENIFVCPRCDTTIQDLNQGSCRKCGFSFIADGYFNLTDDPNIKIEEGQYKYIGYDDLADNYDEPRLDFHACDDAVVRVISESINPTSIILDVGTGTGAMSLELSRHGHRIIAGDISGKMLRKLSEKVCQSGYQDVVPVRLNALDLPIHNGVIDVVTAFYLFHLVENPERILDEIARVLKPSGVFITVFTDFKGLENSINSKVLKVYFELIKEFDIKLVKGPGWSPNEIEDNLKKRFPNHAEISRDELSFSLTMSLKSQYRKVEGKTNSYQLEIDDETHRQVMRKLNERLVNELGEDYLDIEEPVRLTHTIWLFKM